MLDDPQFRRPIRERETETLHVGMTGSDQNFDSGDFAAAASQTVIYAATGLGRIGHSEHHVDRG